MTTPDPNDFEPVEADYDDIDTEEFEDEENEELEDDYDDFDIGIKSDTPEEG